ncbi:uncharacterized protein PAC_09133 [Phialocephala subalpina]|uniref:Uncharacterized protein n=1 Tax=Phialocephala subalpina TaxID=576137 RepID=A0A1L7X2J5_9HELO|nr:uncharacterized protein PAC_09133 [Phialocephala subalpina]
MGIWASVSLVFWLSQATLVVGFNTPTITLTTTQKSTTVVATVITRPNAVVSEVSWITSTITLPITDKILIWTTTGGYQSTTEPVTSSWTTYTTTISTMVAVTSSFPNTALSSTSTPTSAPTTFATLPTQSTSATPPANITITQQTQSNTPTIIGEAIGAVFGAAFLGVLIWACCRKRRPHQDDNTQQGRMRRISESWLPKVLQPSQTHSNAPPLQMLTPIPMVALAQQPPSRPARPASLTKSTVYEMSSSPTSYGRNKYENMPISEDYYGVGHAEQQRNRPDVSVYQTTPPRPASSMYSQQPYAGSRGIVRKDSQDHMDYAIDKTIDSIRGSPGPSAPRPYRESVDSLEYDDHQDEHSRDQQGQSFYTDYRTSEHYEPRPFQVPPVPLFRRDEDEDDHEKLSRERVKALEQLEGRRHQYDYDD